MRKGTPIGAHVGLLVAIVALLPGVLAMLAAGVGGDPLASSLCLTQAAGACSVAALQGLDRRVVDAPVALPAPAETGTGPAWMPTDADGWTVAAADASPPLGFRPLRV